MRILILGAGKIKYTFELAESFARDKSGGKKVTYTNPVAVEKLSLIHI